jgi:hypothetical protein
MPLIRYQKSPIVVPISDLIIDGTTIKRKARFDSMVYAQSTGMIAPSFAGQTSPGSVVINLTIQHFAQGAEGSYGVALEGKRGFSSYQVNLVADARTLVDATTGEVICDATEYQKVESIEEGGILFGRNFMYENEFFRQIAENVPVVVDEMITTYIETASANGTFD